MRIVVTVTREYEMNEARVLGESSFDPPASDAPDVEKRAWLRESFYELCGFDRDADHVDGTYVRLVGEDGESDFDWPEGL